MCSGQWNRMTMETQNSALQSGNGRSCGFSSPPRIQAESWSSENHVRGAQQISFIRDSYWERGAMQACTLHMMELSNQTVKYVNTCKSRKLDMPQTNHLEVFCSCQLQSHLASNRLHKAATRHWNWKDVTLFWSTSVGQDRAGCSGQLSCSREDRQWHPISFSA